MSNSFSHRKLIAAGLVTAGGASGLALAARLAARYGLVRPDYGSIYGVGQTLTYASHRMLLSLRSLAREFDRSQISKVCPVTGAPPESEAYQRLQARGFSSWRLTMMVWLPAPLHFLSRRSRVFLRAA